MHYYGDIMTVSAEVAANNAVEARKYMDDYLEFHSLIVESMKPAFDTSFFKEDKDLNSAMNDYDAQIKRVGFPLKKQKINRS